jgi:bacillithiol system protein YtxJ
MTENLRKVRSLAELDDLFAASFKYPVVIFKHSNACGTSAFVLAQMSAVNGDVNMVIVQESRPISDAVTERIGRRHHTPQVFIVRGGEAVYHATHYAIDPTAINKLIDREEL